MARRASSASTRKRRRPESALVVLPGNEAFAARLARRLRLRAQRVEIHTFPDGESRARLPATSGYRDTIVLATLARPNECIMPLLLAAGALRDHGARRLTLVAPYLAYMRQDRAFRPGEGVSARHFARLLSQHFDALVTIDPHLHRISALDQVFSIPARVLHAAPAIADWIATQVRRPVIVGPDSESAQWVRQVAALAAVPYVVLDKVRRGDRRVRIRLPAGGDWLQRTPVLVDDIIASAGTMIEAVRSLRAAGTAAPVCVGVHALLAGDAVQGLARAGIAQLATCNSIPHPSNAIDLAPLVAAALPLPR